MSEPESVEKLNGGLSGATKLERLHCWPEVKLMIQNSIPISKIGHHIQNVRGEYLEVTPKSLEVMIRGFINRNHDKLIDCRIPLKYLNLLDSVLEHVDPLDAANMLFAIQMDRVMMHYAKEKTSKSPIADNTQDIRLGDQIIRTMSLLKSDSFKHRMALLDAKDGSKSSKETYESIENVKKAYQERFGSKAAVTMLNPESRAKVYSAISRIRKGDSEPVLKILRDNTEKATQLAQQAEAEAARDIATISDNLNLGDE